MRRIHEDAAPDPPFEDPLEELGLSLACTAAPSGAAADRTPRTLAWRGDPPPDPYDAALSEVLAAQAEVRRVTRKLRRRLNSPKLRRLTRFLPTRGDEA